MRNRAIIVSTIVAIGLTLGAHAESLPEARTSFGFGVSVPYALPVDWQASYSFVSSELLLTPNVTIFLDVGTYPVLFPILYEAGASVLVRGWVGPTVLFAGGGVSMQYRRVGHAWSFKPFLNLRAGYQIWLLDSVAVSVHFRTLEAMPIQWVFSPEIALGLNIALGRARPSSPTYDGEYLWVLVGLAAAALVAFLPRT
jgi:hypothetical protein